MEQGDLFERLLNETYKHANSLGLKRSLKPGLDNLPLENIPRTSSEQLPEENIHRPHISKSKKIEGEKKRDVLAFKIKRSSGSYCIEKQIGEPKGSFLYPTSGVEEKEYLLSHLFHKRFPFYEDHLFNLSDPGLSWWFQSSENSFEVYFKSQSIERIDHFTQLGPIGDPVELTDFFKRMETFFRFHFELETFVITQNCIKVEIAKDSDFEIFNALKGLFEKGSFSIDRRYFSNNMESEEIYQYLKLLSSARLFWINIQKHLNLH